MCDDLNLSKYRYVFIGFLHLKILLQSDVLKHCLLIQTTFKNIFSLKMTLNSGQSSLVSDGTPTDHPQSVH